MCLPDNTHRQMMVNVIPMYLYASKVTQLIVCIRAMPQFGITLLHQGYVYHLWNKNSKWINMYISVITIPLFFLHNFENSPPLWDTSEVRGSNCISEVGGGSQYAMWQIQGSAVYRNFIMDKLLENWKYILSLH